MNDMPLRCWACTEREGKETMVLLNEFASDIKWSKSVGLEADAICAACATLRATKRRRASNVDPEVRDMRMRAGLKARQDHVRCVACEVEKPEAEFDAEDLARWRAHWHLARDATCKSCSAGMQDIRCVV